MTELKNTVAANIAALRNEHGMTQSQLAERLNYSDKAVSKWERGESVPDVFVLKTIADTFDVTVDYLLEEEHEGEVQVPEKRSAVVKRNRFIISLLAVSLIWMIATFIYVAFAISDSESAFNAARWLLFVYAVVPSTVLLLIFNGIWGKRTFHFPILSALVWSALASVYLSFSALADTNLWMVFILGVPAQVIIVLWAGLRSHR